jgi:lipopolysaccharide export LptBFGC system permease protein LptF
MSGPGSWLRALAVLVCRSSTVERLIDPIVSDLRIEYNAAARSAWRRAGVLLGAYWGFWKAVAIHTALLIACRSHGEHAVFRRVIGFSSLGFALVTVLLVLPPLLDGFAGIMTGKARQAMLALTLIPQALPISIPIGVCIGIMSAIRARALTRRDLFLTVAIGFAATCLVWAVIEWGLPWGNQTFREMVIAEVSDGRIVHIEPGLNELGFSGLAARTDVAAVRHYHLLWALSFAAMPLALLTLAAGARLHHPVFRGSVILLMLFAYYAVLWVSESSLRQGAPVLVVWAPNVVFLGAGLMLMWPGASETSPRIGV